MQTPKKILNRGDAGEDVEVLVNYLEAFGHFQGVSRWVDRTVFDARLESAVARFQTRHGLPVTGQLDDNTLKLMQTPRCGVPDTPFQLLGEGDPWPRRNLTYRFTNYTGDLPQAQVRTAVIDATYKWQLVAGLTFTESGGQADIMIQFAARDHGDGEPFDGPYDPVTTTGGTLAHAFYPPPNGGAIAGDCHFDDDETWTDQSPQPAGTFDLPTVALHEIGHSLGLGHSSESKAVMYAYYSGERRVLHPDDTKRISALYGKPVALQAYKGQFVCAEGGGGREVVANRDAIYGWETFQWLQLDPDHVALRAHNGQFVCAEGGGGREVVANRDAIFGWETFRVHRLGGLNIALQAHNGQFVCAEGGGGREVVANRDAIFGWETFTLINL